MKKTVGLFLIIFFSNNIYSQIHLDQNGIKSSVTNDLSADATQAKRFEVARVGYNSHHWQNGGIMIIELFEVRYTSGYEKYYVQIGYGEGTESTSPKIYLVESRGNSHNAQVVLGNSEDLSTSRGGYINKVIPVYVDIRYYATYKAKITYLRNKVIEVTEDNQIQIIESPTPQNISDFSVPSITEDIVSPGNLRISGDGIHYISNGNVLIGKTTQVNANYKLDVDGSIRANEIKVNLDGADYVFEPGFKLKSINEVEEFIKNNKHLPDIKTASEMQADGVNIGEMNTQLLQKIEELTLYIIDLQRQVDSLKTSVK